MRFERDIAKRLDDDYLAVDYRNFLYGGWRHPKGHIVTKPHEGLILWHEANKALFCPMCRTCGLHNTLCECPDNKVDLCRNWIGQAPCLDIPPWNGEGEDAIRVCDLHGEIPWRKALYFPTLCAFPGNGWAKTTGGLAEFCSDIVGFRPWDGSLTAPAHNNWLWLIICQTLSVSAKLNIQPKLDQMLGSRVLHKDKNSSGGIDHLWVRTLWGIDRLKVASQDQHSRTAATVSPIEGTEYAGVLVDEPPDDSIRAAYGRGLRFGLNNGWGKEAICATFFEGSVEQRAFVFDTFWNASFRRGGPDRSIFVMSGSIHDNPALTPEDKRQIIAKYPEHEREARTWGFYEELAGLIYPEFKLAVHEYDDSVRDILYDKAKPKEPSDWPIYHVIDPHDIRPWFHLWIAQGPDNEDSGLWIFDEWPRGEFERMSHYSDAKQGFNGSYKEYAALIAEIESRFPGGSARVIRRFMDPGFGGSEKSGTPGKVQDALADFGYFFETDFTRDREARHLAVRRYLNGSYKKGQPIDNLHRPHLRVARRCANTKRAFLSYIWDGKKGRPADIGSDPMDALGYVAVNTPAFVSVGRAHNATNTRMIQRGQQMRAARLGGFR